MAPPQPTSGPFGPGIPIIKSKPKPKKPPPKMTGKFKAPPPSQLLGPVPLRPANGAPLPEAERQAMLDGARAFQAKKAAVNREITKRKDAVFKENVRRDVSTKAGLAGPGSLGQVGVAKDTNIPNLTPKVHLAQARQKWLASGGLQSFDEFMQHARSRNVVNQALPVTFADTHQLPEQLAHGFRPTRTIPESPPAPSGGGAWGPSEKPPEPVMNPRVGMGRYHEAHKNDPASIIDWKDALGKGVVGIDRAAGGLIKMGTDGLGIGYESDPLTAAWDIVRGKGVPAGYGRHMRSEAKAGVGGLFPSATEAAGKLSMAGLSVPHGLRIAKDKVNAVAHTKGVSDTTAEAADGTLPAEEAAAIGFTAAYTKTLREMALKKGWYEGELTGLVGMDLLQHAYSSPPPMALRIAQNFGRGAAQTGAFVTGVAGLVDETAHGHGMRAWGQFGSALGKEGLGFLHNPLQAAISDPFTVVPAVGAVGKTAGTVGRLTYLGKEMGVREVKTGLKRKILADDVSGPPSPEELIYSRGQYSKNLWTQIGQRAADKMAGTALRLNKAHGGHFDKLVRRSVNESAHGHTTRQVAYRHALRKLDGHLSGKKKRAEVLLAYLHAGGKPEKILEHYQSLLEGPDGILSGAEAGQAKFLADHVIEQTRNLSQADHDFINAARGISAHTSLTHVELGRFRRAAVLHRQLEPLLLAAQSAARRLTSPVGLTPEMEAANQIAWLRKMVLNPEHKHAPLDSSRIAPRRGKLSEAERTQKFSQEKLDAEVKKLEAERPPAELEDAGAAVHEANLEAHKAKAPVEPELPPTERHGKYVTKAAAARAGKELKDKHGAGTVKITPNRGGKTYAIEYTPKVAVDTAKIAKHHAAKVKRHEERTPVRDPEEIKAHRRAVVNHKRKLKRYDERIERAKAKADAHRTHEAEAAKRGRVLTEAEREQFAKVSDPEAIYQQYERALEDFLQMHLDSGGIEPARIAYTKATLKSVRRKAARGGARLNPKADARRMPPVHASTGRSFASGNYLIDAASPIRESLHAQRLRVGLGVHRLMVEHVAQEVPAGYRIKQGEVAVTKQNMATLATAYHQLDPNLVGDQVAYEASKSAWRRREPTRHDEDKGDDEVASYDRERQLRTDHTAELERVKETGDVTSGPSYVVPKATWDRMIDWTKPVSLNVYSKAMREYQRALISIYPGTVIGNTIGSLPLAWAAGAGPQSFRMAERTMRHGGFGRDLAPSYLYGKGPSGHLEHDAHNPATHYMNTMRGASIAGEDFSRVAAYWSKALPIVKAEGKRIKAEAEEANRKWHADRESFVGPVPGKAEPEPFTKFGANRDVASHDVPAPVKRIEPDYGVPPSLHTAESAFDEAARMFASGKIHPDKLDAVLDHVEKFMGDTHKPQYRLARGIQATHIVLFQNWVAHMAKLVLYTLPVKHPRRMLFLNSMARYGDQYRQEHGAWPAWMVGFFPLMHYTANIPGVRDMPGGAELQHWTHAISMMNLSPQSTAGGLTQSLTADKPALDRIAGISSPPWQLLNNFQNMSRDNRGADEDKKIDPYRYLLNEALGWIPGERKFFPQQGLRGDSLPWDPRAKTYMDPLTHQLQSPFLSPGPYADRGYAGMLERVFGFGGYKVPNEGPITRKQISNQGIYNRPDPGRDAAVHRRMAARKAAQAAALANLNGK